MQDFLFDADFGGPCTIKDGNGSHAAFHISPFRVQLVKAEVLCHIFRSHRRKSVRTVGRISRRFLLPFVRASIECGREVASRAFFRRTPDPARVPCCRIFTTRWRICHRSETCM